MLKIAVVALLFVMSAWPAASAKTFTGSARVVDGDTIEIGITHIRLHGIDTPEPAQPQGKEASRTLARLTEGKEVRCEGTERDHHFK